MNTESTFTTVREAAAKLPRHWTHAALDVGARCTLLGTVISLLLNASARGASYLTGSIFAQTLLLNAVYWMTLTLLVYAVYSIGKPKGTHYGVSAKMHLCILLLGWMLAFLLVAALGGA